MKKITATLDRIEGGVGVLLTNPEAQIINIPLKFLPNDIKEGDILCLTINLESEQTLAEKQQAKEILNEILKSEEEK